ncbi:MAG TPA: outer membrane protein assembly factor BamD, partial [Geobacterales bacterium]|nr:outer membrane protein assembly factor BamD [Geobacterales bacterium]
QSAYALYRQGLANYNQITGIDRDQTPVIEAATLFASFLELYPKGEQSGEVRDKVVLLRTMKARHEIYVGRFYLRTEKYTSAIGRLEGALHDFSGEADLDEALFYLGQAYILSGEQSKGRDTFHRLESDFPQSRFLKKAAKFLARHT